MRHLPKTEGHCMQQQHNTVFTPKKTNSTVHIEIFEVFQTHAVLFLLVSYSFSPFCYLEDPFRARRTRVMLAPLPQFGKTNSKSPHIH